MVAQSVNPIINNFKQSISIIQIDFGPAPKEFSTHQFRKIVSSQVGKLNDAFHNHDLGSGKVIYRQPQIHYFIKANGHFCIMGIGLGVSALKEWFAFGAPVNFHHTKMNWRTIQSEVYEFTHELLYSSESLPHKYTLKNYFALNTNNYPRFQRLKNKEQRKAFLANILSQHIHTFARSFSWEIPAFVNVCHIMDYNINVIRNYENNKAIKTFDLSFYSPLALPDAIFLGKRTSLGFGQLKVCLGS